MRVLEGLFNASQDAMNGEGVESVMFDIDSRMLANECVGRETRSRLEHELPPTCKESFLHALHVHVHVLYCLPYFS